VLPPSSGRNVSKLLSDYTVQQLIRQPSSYSPPWELEISLRLYFLHGISTLLVPVGGMHIQSRGLGTSFLLRTPGMWQYCPTNHKTRSQNYIIETALLSHNVPRLVTASLLIEVVGWMYSVLTTEMCSPSLEGHLIKMGWVYSMNWDTKIHLRGENSRKYVTCRVQCPLEDNTNRKRKLACSG
jgi:hypothetical protein